MQFNIRFPPPCGRTAQNANILISRTANSTLCRSYDAIRCMQPITVSKLIDRFDALFIDAYGVLVTSQGALPGASEFIKAIEARQRPYFILTNDASRLPETAAAYYARCGIQIPTERVITAGLAIGEAFVRKNITRPRCFVLGTQETHEYVRRLGGETVMLTDHAEYDAMVIGDDSGFDILPTMNAALSSLSRMIRAGKSPLLLLANPDLLYPRGPGLYGYTSGSLARLIELGLEQFFPELGLRFEALGKPGPLLFEMALKKSGAHPSRVAMLGDQLHTDVKGANLAGITSVLVGSGLTTLPLPNNLPDAHCPNLILKNLL